MKISTIQLKDDTKKKLDAKKIHPRESYDSVLKRILESKELPSMDEMFRKGDAMKHKAYATQDVVKLSHELRKK